MEVGQLVRTPKGICKIEGFVSTLTDDYIENEKGSLIPKDEITKVSHNIIDLIEAGDYVNGVRVERIDKDPFIKGQINLWTNEIMSNYWGDISLTPIRDKDIKTIVTKEQFEAMQYEIK